MTGLRSIRSAVVTMAWMAAAALVVTGCSGAAGGAGGGPVLDAVTAHEVEVNGLELTISRVRVHRDRVEVDATLHNPGDEPYSLLLGGCGPSQGRVSTANGWREVYYQVRPEGDLGGVVGPGESRSGTITLKPAERLDPESVTRLQLHPGYVLNAGTGQLELLQVMLSLEEGGTQ